MVQPKIRYLYNGAIESFCDMGEWADRDRQGFLRMEIPMIAIFRQESALPRPVRNLPVGEFIYCRKPGDALSILPAILEHYGLAGTLKLLLMLGSPTREFSAVRVGQRLVARAWVQLGSCKAYPVETSSAVLESVWTDPSHQRMGLAEALLGRDLNHLVERRIQITYIDTDQNNLPMLKVIDRLGYGEPMGFYEAKQPIPFGN